MKFSVSIVFKRTEISSGKTSVQEKLFLCIVNAVSSAEALGIGIHKGSKVYDGFSAALWATQVIQGDEQLQNSKP